MPITSSIKDRVAEIVFDVPPVNAFDSETWLSLPSIITAASSNPAVHCVLIRAEGANLEMKATDLDLEINEATAAMVEQAGATTVPAHLLYEIVRKLADGKITVEAAGLAKSGLETFAKEAGIGNASEKTPLDWTNGIFEIRTLNHSLDGNGRSIPTAPAPTGKPQLRIMQWTISPGTDQIPLAQIAQTP